jgi:hypothetical protein
MAWKISWQPLLLVSHLVATAWTDANAMKLQKGRHRGRVSHLTLEIFGNSVFTQHCECPTTWMRMRFSFCQPGPRRALRCLSHKTQATNGSRIASRQLTMMVLAGKSAAQGVHSSQRLARHRPRFSCCIASIDDDDGHSR